MQAKDGKIALVLAGGGVAGAVYEIGALRAIDDLLVDRTVNDFDIYVGTSAGSLVASGLANGLSPEAMLQAFEGSHPEIWPLERSHLFRFNNGEFLRRSLALPGALVGAWLHYLRNVKDLTLFDLLWFFLGALPSGLYDGMALERYVRTVLSGPGRSNRFVDLDRDLYIIATDLNSGERVVFGRDGMSEVPISLAVAASSALPLLYKPVRVHDAEYVDGGVRATASVDLAIERGATLIICINPLVPLDNGSRDSTPSLVGDGGHLSKMGGQAIASQISRIATHSGLHSQISQLRRQHADVDIIIVEPRPDDDRMFFCNIMRYSERLNVARHGFESVTVDLAKDFHHFKRVLARHGVPLTRRLVTAELAEIQRSGCDVAVVRRILEARSPACNRQRRSTPVCRLTRTLAELDLVLDRMAAPS
jgi:predicted acylesterase/phospholipase RssA